MLDPREYNQVEVFANHLKRVIAIVESGGSSGRPMDLIASDDYTKIIIPAKDALKTFLKERKP